MKTEGEKMSGKTNVKCPHCDKIHLVNQDDLGLESVCSACESVFVLRRPSAVQEYKPQPLIDRQAIDPDKQLAITRIDIPFGDVFFLVLKFVGASLLISIPFLIITMAILSSR